MVPSLFFFHAFRKQRSRASAPCRVILASLLIMLALGASGAEIYKWVDEAGRVHFGDRPPAEGAEPVELDVSPAPAAPAPSDAERAEKRRRLLEAFAKERAEKEAAIEQAKQEKAERAANCARARERLRKVREATYLYDYDESGNRVIFSDEQREEATRQAKAEVERWCG